MTWSLDDYRLLGRSGLRVSPVALGTMTFGADWGWGATEEEARRIFETYLDLGGNFIDTANQYTNGTSESLIGKFATQRRDRLVIATKYTLPADAKDPNSGGNHRKSMVCSVERSLKRLRCDYIDVLYLHAWDNTTPIEEILRAMDDLVRAGKVLYLGISDTAAWLISRMQAVADLRGWAPLIAVQMEYSLIERTGERELIPMAKSEGLGVIAWSPLASGVLSGKYAHSDLIAEHRQSSSSVGLRRQVVIDTGLLSERALAIADVTRQIANESGKSSAQVALAWVLQKPDVTCPVLGARTLSQMHDNLGALTVELSLDHMERLERASAIEFGFPHEFLNKVMRPGGFFGDVKIGRRR